MAERPRRRLSRAILSGLHRIQRLGGVPVFPSLKISRRPSVTGAPAVRGRRAEPRR